MTDENGVVSLDDLRLTRQQSRQLALHNMLIYHVPRHTSCRAGDEGPITNCACGALRLGESWAWHVAALFLSLEG